jgi:hypothetical protein
MTRQSKPSATAGGQGKGNVIKVTRQCVMVSNMEVNGLAKDVVQ